MALTCWMQINIIAFLMCVSIRGFSNLFTNESNDRRFVYRPPNSKAN